ncbi:MAG: glutathione S-transferase family protein [Pseudomonadota bacterium]
MITLHHLEYSQSFRILWLLEELGVEYQLKLYNRDPKTHLAPLEYKRLSPLGSAPVIEHDGKVLAESSAIIDYILDVYPSDTLRPQVGAPNRVRYLFWMHVAQGSMMPIMLMDSIFRIIIERLPFFLKPIVSPILKAAANGFAKPRMNALLDVAEKDLSSADWFGGDQLTAADINLSYPFESANMRGYLTDTHPNCKAWLERMYAHPSFVAAKAKDDRASMVLSL